MFARVELANALGCGEHAVAVVADQLDGGRSQQYAAFGPAGPGHAQAPQADAAPQALIARAGAQANHRQQAINEQQRNRQEDIELAGEFDPIAPQHREQNADRPVPSRA